ncbi:MAG: OmpA family protein [Alphaproteobacteria bacterium]|nr:OmpA family protein [Alphaproteobacteria bacterium]
MRALVLALIAPLAFAAAPAGAQRAPSAEQLIQALKPGPGQLSDTTRGIRAIKAKETAEAAAPSVDLSVEFATASSALTPQARTTLDALGKALSSADLAQYRFRIEGHTDTVGSAAYNTALSERRAQAVADYLEKSFGVASARLEPVGMGEQGLLVPTPPQTPNAQNRRVKVVNLGG